MSGPYSLLRVVRAWRQRGYLTLTALALGTAVASASDDQSLIDILATRQPNDVAMVRGLAWLRAHQGADGFIADRYQVGVTGLFVVAHLAAGITPADPTNGPGLRQALAAILMAQREGYFGSLDGGRMYSHGIATLALAHSLGMTGDAELDQRIRQALVQAVGVTIAAARHPKPAHDYGGWRYSPADGAADMSLTGWQLLSLHAAGQVGIEVPTTVVDNAVEYVRRMTSITGQVGYEDPGDQRALRGIAVVGLGFAAKPDDERIRAVEGRIIAEPLTWQGPWFFYQAYYDALALSRMSTPASAAATAALEAVLRDHQDADGSWPAPPGDNETGHGAAYTTAMAVLALGVGKRLLPAYR